MDIVSSGKFRNIESIFSWREDLEFIESEPGYTNAIGRQFCKSRSRLGRRWMRELRAEFDRLYKQGQLILVASPVDRPDLTRELWRLKRQFYVTLVSLEIRFLLHISLASDVRQLTTTFEHLIGYTLIADSDLALKRRLSA